MQGVSLKEVIFFHESNISFEKKVLITKTVLFLQNERMYYFFKKSVIFQKERVYYYYYYYYPLNDQR